MPLTIEVSAHPGFNLEERTSKVYIPNVASANTGIPLCQYLNQQSECVTTQHCRSARNFRSRPAFR